MDTDSANCKRREVSHQLRNLCLPVRHSQDHTASARYCHACVKSRWLFCQGQTGPQEWGYNDCSGRYSVHFWGTGNVSCSSSALTWCVWIWFWRKHHSSLTTDPRHVLQDPVTGSCYNDIIMMDSRSWQWMALEVHTWLSMAVCISCFTATCCQLMWQRADITRICQHCRETMPHLEDADICLQNGNTALFIAQ